MSQTKTAMREFVAVLADLPNGYFEGAVDGERYGVTLKRSEDQKRIWLYAEALGGGGHISFNLYQLDNGKTLLKPCEMSEQKVIDFVLGIKRP